MSTARRRGRILAMQALSEWEVQKDRSSEHLVEFLRARQASGQAASHALAILESYWAHNRRIDDRISSAAAHWTLERISLVERNVLRAAVAEHIAKLAPMKVIVNEAVEISREYGGAESPQFVNGVLGRILTQLPGPDKGPAE